MKNLLALFAVVFLALAGCNEPEDDSCDACTKVSNLVELGKKEIGAGNFSEAVEFCESALEIDTESTDARYCIVIGRLGNLSLALNTILTRLGSMLPERNIAGFSPSIDYKRIVMGFVKDSEEEMAAIDEHLYELAKVENLQFQIPLFPIHLKFQKLADFYNSYFYGAGEYQLPGELIFNAGGTWDRSEIVALGAVFNTVLGVLDYSLAHDFNLGSIPASNNILGFFAELFLANPDLLHFSPTEESRARLYGGVGDKGFSNDVIALLSYVSGRSADLVNAAPANPGLKAAIIESAALAATDAVIHWNDGDGDGHADTIASPIFGDISEQLGGIRVDQVPAVLSPGTMDALYALSAALLDNIENKADPASPQALLEGLRADIGGFLGVDSIAQKKVPDFVHLSFGAFLAAPLPIRKLLPLLYEVEDNWNGTAYGMLYDWELEGTPPQKRYFDFNDNYSQTAYALDHFSGLPDGAFKEFTPLTGVAIADDGVTPNASVTSLLYVALQSPSFGGLVYVDPSSLGGAAKMGEASSQTINETLARLVKYYCFDFGYDYGTVYPSFKDACPDGSESE